MPATDSDALLDAALASAGLRRTPATIALARLFTRGDDLALSPGEVERALGAAGAGVNRVTVYRLLERFVAAGFLRRAVDTHRVWRFSLAESQPEPAPRFECDECHRQFGLGDGARQLGAAARKALAALQAVGHEALSVDVSVHGRCAGCASHPAGGRLRLASGRGPAVIATHGLGHRYAGGAALTFRDVLAPQGTVLLLQGPSGAGKSTWLALAAGLLKATEGEIVVAGQSLRALDDRERDAWRARTLGFLPQRLHLSEALTVAENLALAYFAAGQPRDDGAIRAALDALGVLPLARRRPSQLSGGQAQRVALARAVLLQPKVLLADEPTASLDDAAARDALRLLADTAGGAGATLAIATHDRRVQEALPSAFVHEIGLHSAPVLDSSL